MSLRLSRIVLGGLTLLAAGASHAETFDRMRWTPQAVASAVEHEASTTSFTELERFGHDAVDHRRLDRLARLQHVEWLFINQDDFPRFTYWDGLLRSEALKAHDARYVAVADLDALHARRGQGDRAAAVEIERIETTTSDWFVRCRAMLLRASDLIDQGQAAEALHLLAIADGLASAAGDDAARADVWEIEGTALMQLHDLDGSALAFGRSQFEFGRPGYPRPDFDPIFNMSESAAQQGRLDLAQSLYEADHRLALRAGIPADVRWDQALCAMVQHARDNPQGVLDCVVSMGPDLRDARFVEHHVLPERAMAYARLGHIDLAERDLATITERASRKGAKAQFADSLPEVSAAILHAKGRDAEAYETLRRDKLDHDAAQAKRFSQGVGQLTAQMAQQMDVRQLQLATAQKNLALVHRVVRDQRILTFMGALVVVTALVTLAWQFRVLRQLRAARAAAEAGSRAKGEFLANMSHEIRTPLNGLLTMADLMDRGAMSRDQRKRLSIVRQSGQDLLCLLNDILDFSKIEAGKLELEAIVFDPQEVLEATLAGFSADAEQKGLHLWFELGEDARGLRRGDPARVRQIASNFISNALKFTKTGSVSVIVDRLDGEGRDCLRLAVRDTGLGIPADKMELLFQKFSQVDASTTRRFGGTGLGLAICQELAAMMGGRVWAESIEGEGSTFYATLMMPYVGEAQPSEPPAAPQADAETPMAPLRVLAAEDNPTNQLVLSTIMQMFGFELTLVGDGARAVEAWGREAFDVILMDVQMPVMDGMQATAAIRAAEREFSRPVTPIIALSANAFKHQVDEYLAVGMNAHVAKPIDLNALQHTLEAVLTASAATGAAKAA